MDTLHLVLNFQLYRHGFCLPFTWLFGCFIIMTVNVAGSTPAATL